MDKLDELLFDAARHETAQAGFDAAWDNIRQMHNKKKRARRTLMLRCASLAAMLIIGLSSGIFFERAGMLTESAPPVILAEPPVPANTPEPTLPGAQTNPSDVMIDPPKLDGTPEPFLPGIEITPAPESIGVPTPDNSEPMPIPTVPPDDIFVDPPKTDPGDASDVTISPPKTSGDPYFAPPQSGDGQDVRFPDDKRFPNLPLDGDMFAYLPAWLPEGYGEPMMNPDGAYWYASVQDAEIPSAINAGLIPASQVSLTYKIGLAKRMGRSCIIQTETDAFTEWVIRISNNMYLRLWFDNLSYEDTVRVIESMGL